ncbi:protein CURVATURE THYLAKOID 1C, chloroplastic [Heracleum sosnowskyi]|uniref:Protein CURVATURE THYLAKOID 1C, chloroplastic n=1 Tax=Heracleum sosnowskyi TaxID=360622 RepID=A0AAD8I029_9APIA|nr:protein CURVATURE THYLAKOID 1C, chloroplastic [Heracleum sosnowskyi]
MASTITSLTLPPLFSSERQTLFRPLIKFPVLALGGEKQFRVTVAAKAAGDSSESSTSLSIVESVQNIWDNSEDRIALFGLGFAGVVALWASANLITAIDKLPLIPGVLEFVGILFSSWFVYRYLLFKPDRQELGQAITKKVSDILGQ